MHVNIRTIATALAVTAVVLLVAAEFATVYEVTVGSLETVKRSATGGANHGYALALIALAAAAATIALAARAGGLAPAVALAVLGAVALLIVLSVDLPDTRGSGRLPESLAYEDARARAGSALYLGLAGGALLIVAGGLFALAARREQ